MFTNFVKAIAGGLMLACGANAQHDLPDQLVKDIEYPPSWAEEISLPIDGDDGIEALVCYSNKSENSITFEWFFHHGAAKAGHTTQVVPVSFQPTAVCRRAGSSNRVYVAGWYPRTGTVVVEEWVFEGWALGSVIQPVGGAGEVDSGDATSTENSGRIICCGGDRESNWCNGMQSLWGSVDRSIMEFT